MKIDQIQIKGVAGHRLVSLDEWLDMPLWDRVSIINEDRLQFLAGGDPVPMRDALEAIVKSTRAAL